jgi:hypothetical protein
MRLSYYEKLAVEKFRYKNYDKNGFLRYSYWSRRLRDMFGEKLTKYEIKKIFNSLLEHNYFFIRKIGKSSNTYQFINKEKLESKNVDKSKFTIIFD